MHWIRAQPEPHRIDPLVQSIAVCQVHGYSAAVTATARHYQWHPIFFYLDPGPEFVA